MGRPPRDYHPDGIYHLTTHGIDDRPIFRDDTDRQEFCIRFHRVVRSDQWDVYAGCLMDTHYHLLVGPKLGRISEGMKLLNGGYSRAFNKRHGRRGALFESRFADTTIQDEEHFQNTVLYIEENPVAAGMVELLEDWTWTTGTAGSPLLVPGKASPAAAWVSDTSSHQPAAPKLEEVSDTSSHRGKTP